MYYFGIDVSQKASAICVLNESGQVVAETTVVTEAEALERWLRDREPGRAVIEAAPSGAIPLESKVRCTAASRVGRGVAPESI